MALPSKKKLLVAGARGIVGRSTVNHFSKLKDWDVVGLSRSKSDFDAEIEWKSVDLQNAEDCKNKLADLKDITHICYSAVFEKDNVTAGWAQADHAEINLKMLRNLVENAERNAPNLAHITLMQGTKAYGGHLGPFKMPARETDPRSMGPNFYYDQMDWLSEFQKNKKWTWTILRPQLVCGVAAGSPLNIIAAIGAFAAISREVGIPLRFPGGAERIGEATDARLIARAVEWVGNNEIASNQIYNITNGDVYIWHYVWPRVAELFDMEYGSPQPMSLAKLMPENAKVWSRIIEKHSLKNYSLAELIPSWRFADYIFGYGQRPNPHHMSNIKIRKHGFADCIDTEEMILELLQEMQLLKVIPS